MINIPRAFCVNGYEATTICAVDSCSSCAFICQFSNCTCKIAHKNCLSISSYESVVNKLLQKSFQFGGSFDKILKWYQDTVNLIIVERQGLLKKKNRVNLQGLEQCEKRFLRYLNGGEFFNITGKAVFDIVKTLKEKPKGDTCNYNNKINIQIDSVRLNLESIRKLWDDQIRDREIIKQHCWHIIEGENEVNVNSNFDLSSITYLGMGKIHQQSIKVIGMQCYSLSQLYLSDKQKLNGVELGKYDIEYIGKHLKNRLKKLAIKSQSLTMKEVELITLNLPFLSQLIFEDAIGISAKDHKEIQRLLPGCMIKFI